MFNVVQDKYREYELYFLHSHKKQSKIKKTIIVIVKLNKNKIHRYNLREEVQNLQSYKAL